MFGIALSAFKRDITGECTLAFGLCNIAVPCNACCFFSFAEVRTAFSRSVSQCGRSRNLLTIIEPRFDMTRRPPRPSTRFDAGLPTGGNHTAMNHPKPLCESTGIRRKRKVQFHGMRHTSLTLAAAERACRSNCNKHEKHTDDTSSLPPLIYKAT